MAYVMGGSNYENHKLFRKFKDLCYAAFHAVRKQAPVLESLFLLVWADLFVNDFASRSAVTEI